MIGLPKKALMAVALGVGAISAVGYVYADGCGYPPCEKILCHNIGGPRDLGANCEATGNCTVPLANGSVLTFRNDEFLGIVINANDQSLSAHLAHGDGFARRIFDPALHLASQIGPHRASNVECLARRATTEQPPEPGN